MIKRIIEISQRPVRLSLRLEQLLIEPRDGVPAPTPQAGPEFAPGAGAKGRMPPAPAAAPHPAPAPASIPCEDIGLILVEHPQTTYTHQALAALMRHGVALVVCGQNHLPAGLLLPFSTHTEVVWRIQDQIDASKPCLKQLWQQIVIAKIRAQAGNLRPGSIVHGRLLELAREVKTGDTTNVEAQAARLYWSAWLEGFALPPLPFPGAEGEGRGEGLVAPLPLGEVGGEHGEPPGEGPPDSPARIDPANLQTEEARLALSAIACKADIPEDWSGAGFRRDADSLDPLNAMLNYGYAVLRAAVARALVGAGLFPALGLHHCNRSNNFALADDLVEPLRPLIDDRVRRLYAQGTPRGLDQPTKGALIQVLQESVRQGHQTGPLMVALHRYAASLVPCLRREKRDLDIPIALPPESGGAGD